MSADLDKAILVSDYNAFKNDSILNSGSIQLPTSIGAGATATVTTVVPLGTSPQFSEFTAYFTEALDLTTFTNGTYGNPQWYPGIMAASGMVGVWVTAPLANRGVITAVINPVIIGSSVSVQAVVTNPYSNTITLGALTVPFAFTEYSLAN